MNDSSDVTGRPKEGVKPFYKWNLFTPGKQLCPKCIADEFGSRSTHDEDQALQQTPFPMSNAMHYYVRISIYLAICWQAAGAKMSQVIDFYSTFLLTLKITSSFQTIGIRQPTDLCRHMFDRKFLPLI